jgi:hypothetical protein
MTAAQIKDLANGLSVVALLLIFISAAAMAFYREWIVMGSYARRDAEEASKKYDDMREELTKQITFWQQETVSAKQSELATKTENSILLREMAATLKDLASRLSSTRHERYHSDTEDVYGHIVHPRPADAGDRHPPAQERRREAFGEAPKARDRE